MSQRYFCPAQYNTKTKPKITLNNLKPNPLHVTSSYYSYQHALRQSIVFNIPFLGVGGPRRVTLHYNDWRGSFGSSPMVGGLRFDITPRSWRKQETNWNKILPDARWILKGRGLRKCGVPEQDCLVSELSSGVTQCHFLLGETEKLVN